MVGVCFLATVLAAQKDPALDRARQALARGDTTQAIPLLENYRQGSRDQSGNL